MRGRNQIYQRQIISLDSMPIDLRVMKSPFKEKDKAERNVFGNN